MIITYREVLPRYRQEDRYIHRAAVLHHIRSVELVESEGMRLDIMGEDRHTTIRFIKPEAGQQAYQAVVEALLSDKVVNLEVFQDLSIYRRLR